MPPVCPLWVLGTLAERAAVVVFLWPPWPLDDLVEESLLVSVLCCLHVAAPCVAAPHVVCGLLVAWCALWLHRWHPSLWGVAGGAHFAFPFRASPWLAAGLGVVVVAPLLRQSGCCVLSVAWKESAGTLWCWLLWGWLRWLRCRRLRACCCRRL